MKALHLWFLDDNQILYYTSREKTPPDFVDINERHFTPHIDQLHIITHP